MARSDFLKRAMGVPTDAHAVPAQAKEAEAVDPKALSPRPLKTASTAPSAMMNFMVERSEVHRELEAAQARLSEFDGALVAKPLDPKLIKASAYANRSSLAFGTRDFESLKEEIAAANGNVQPIKVRRAASKDEQYEIVYGHRRHRACADLGLPVLAIIVPELDDRSLFVEMERENRGRADLSAWEQGLHYIRALESGLFPSLRKLAEALGVDPSLMAKAVALGKLPKEVVDAFGSPLELQFRWAPPLREALQKDPDGLIARAKAIATLPKRPAASEILRQLTTPGIATPAAAREWTDASGRAVAKLDYDAKGRVKISFFKSLSEAEVQKLTQAVGDLLG